MEFVSFFIGAEKKFFLYAVWLVMAENLVMVYQFVFLYWQIILNYGNTKIIIILMALVFKIKHWKTAILKLLITTIINKL